MKEQEIAPGIKLLGFNSLEEILEYQEKAYNEAEARTLDIQREITYGDYVFRLHEEILIFGRVSTQEEFLGNNLRGQEDEYNDEIRAEWAGIEEAHTRGYRYGRYHSNVCPEGEWGSSHVSTLWKITADDFEVAERNDWQMTPDMALRIGYEIKVAVAKEGKA